MVNLLDNEKIILMRRRHWFVIAAEAASLFLLAVFPFVGLWIAGGFFPELARFLSENWLLIIFYWAAWAQFIWMIFFIAWTNYYLDILVVTNKRIIDIEQLGLFSRDLVELRLENIQDIKVEISGLIPSLLKMGNFHIQTAGQSKEVLIKNLPEAHEVKTAIASQLEARHINRLPDLESNQD